MAADGSPTIPIQQPSPRLADAALQQRKHELKGTLIVFGGVLWLTPDSLLVKQAQLGIATGTEVLFWRNAIYGVVVALVFTAWTWRKQRRLLPDAAGWCSAPAAVAAQVRATGWLGLLVTGGQSLSNTGFVLAQSNANAAKVLVVVATAPVFAALFGRMFLGDPVPHNP
jgi:drug/metabolite transporter (DMT)-like permease